MWSIGKGDEKERLIVCLVQRITLKNSEKGTVMGRSGS